MLCVYGGRDRHAACNRMPADGVRVVMTPGDHHFAGQYEADAHEIAVAAEQAPPETALR